MSQQPYEPTERIYNMPPEDRDDSIQPLYLPANGRHDEPTERVYLPPGSYEAPTAQGDASQYFSYLDVAPIPLPPPPPKRPPRWLWWIAGVLLVLVVFGGTAYGFYSLGYGQARLSQRGPGVVTSSATTTPVLALGPATPGLATSTPGVTTALASPDFNAFLESFATAMANKDYNTIQAATDTQNFQSMKASAPGEFDNWGDMYNRLSTGSLSFTIRYPPVTADEAGYSCLQYTRRGSQPLSLTIKNASAVQYVVGAAFELDQMNFNESMPNSTVFAFERLAGPSPSWLWRAVIFDNWGVC